MLVQHDSYYRHRPELSFEERSRVNYDHPDSLETELLIEHLGMLSKGAAIDRPTYDFTRHLRADETDRVEPAPVMIVEGILVLADRDLREHLDLKIYVDTDPDIRLARRLGRDIEERGRTTAVGPGAVLRIRPTDASRVRRAVEALRRPDHSRGLQPGSRGHGDRHDQGQSGRKGPVHILAFVMISHGASMNRPQRRDYRGRRHGQGAGHRPARSRVGAGSAVTCHQATRARRSVGAETGVTVSLDPRAGIGGAGGDRGGGQAP